MLVLTPETEALVRDRARRSGKTPDELVRDAVNGLPPPASTSDTVRIDRAGLAQLLAELDALPPRDAPSAKDILDEGWGH